MGNIVRVGEGSKGYVTLEEDLRRVFEKRGIEVEEVSVLNGATKYVIKAKRQNEVSKYGD